MIFQDDRCREDTCVYNQLYLLICVLQSNTKEMREKEMKENTAMKNFHELVDYGTQEVVCEMSRLAQNLQL